MTDASLLTTATAGHPQVPADWMPVAKVRPLIFEDPAVLWLEYHGQPHGFKPDPTPYLDFIAEKGSQFVACWLEHMAPQAVEVCHSASEARQADKVRQTLELILQGTPVVSRPALWWASECIYGVPDVIALSSWLNKRFPGLLAGIENGQSDHYIALGLKFTTRLDESQKARDLANYAAQLRLYTFMLGGMQGYMPNRAYLFTRDRVADPLPVEIHSVLGQPLDADLADLRDRFVEIRVNGSRYLPWENARLASNLANADERWRTAKDVIARQKVPGGDACLLYQVGPKAKDELAALGYPSLASLLDCDCDTIPLEKVKGFGAKKCSQVRTILKANRSKSPVLPAADRIPSRYPFEFYIDYEYFTNVNVDFTRQWPTLEGYEMVFMIGIGWEQAGAWRFEPLIAAAEDIAQEFVLFERFIDRLNRQTGGVFTDPHQTVLYHWSGAELWQTQHAIQRARLAADHPLYRLPWHDLQKVFLDGPAALPGTLDFGLKTVARALGELDTRFTPQWSQDLDAGQQVIVMAWQAYRTPNPLESEQFKLLSGYLEADCKALWNILSWLRSQC